MGERQMACCYCHTSAGPRKGKARRGMTDGGYEKVEFALGILDKESRESERVEREREGGGGRELASHQ